MKNRPVRPALIHAAFLTLLVGLPVITALRDSSDRDHERAASADLRTLATAAESRATDTNDYPAVTSLEALRRIVGPKYILTMPMQDEWGSPYLYRYWIGPTGVPQSYLFLDMGADHSIDAESMRLLRIPPTAWKEAKGEMERLRHVQESLDRPPLRPCSELRDRDLIYADGSFLTWLPRDSVEGDHCRDTMPRQLRMELILLVSGYAVYLAHRIWWARKRRS